MKRATAFGWLLVFGAAVMVAGCATIVPEPALIREPRPEPVPLVVAVHYSDEFRSLVYRKTSGPRVFNAFALGESSVKLLDEALALLFVRVVRVSGLPPTVRGENAVAGVIEPRIAEASYEVPPPPGGSPAPAYVVQDRILARARITYAFTLYSSEGKQLASWHVSGHGVGMAEVYTGVELAYRHVQRSFEHAMREAAWKLTSEFRAMPDVRRWLDEHGMK